MTFVSEVYHIFTVVYFYWNFEWQGKKNQPLNASFTRINEKKLYLAFKSDCADTTE